MELNQNSHVLSIVVIKKETNKQNPFNTTNPCLIALNPVLFISRPLSCLLNAC